MPTLKHFRKIWNPKQETHPILNQNMYPMELQLSICHKPRIHKEPGRWTINPSCQFPPFQISFCFIHSLPTKLGNVLAANTVVQQMGSKQVSLIRNHDISHPNHGHSVPLVFSCTSAAREKSCSTKSFLRQWIMSEKQNLGSLLCLCCRSFASSCISPKSPLYWLCATWVSSHRLCSSKTYSATSRRTRQLKAAALRQLYPEVLQPAFSSPS